MKDVKHLPALLRAVSHKRRCKLRAAAAKYYRTLMWQEPMGLAFEMVLLSLCRRALALHSWERPAPSWAAGCTRVTVDTLLR
eukprot:6391428-Prymnesium_polylepis.1